MRFHLKLALLLPFLSSLPHSNGAPNPLQPPYCPPQPATPHEQTILFNQFVKEFYVQQNIQQNVADALSTYVAKNLIQHNPNLPNGSAAELEIVVPIFANYTPQVQHVMVTGGYGMIFNRFTPRAGTVGLPAFTAVMDLYRFEGSCLVEHWDVIEALPPNSTNPDPF
jgi:predicted SnoaL-like aldol condensation-catalyzing enzyme